MSPQSIKVIIVRDRLTYSILRLFSLSSKGLPRGETLVNAFPRLTMGRIVPWNRHRNDAAKPTMCPLPPEPNLSSRLGARNLSAVVAEGFSIL